jgi:peptidoglycan/LPS O-acetylase OafA/YrhL
MDYLRHPQTWSYLRTLSLASIQTELPGVFSAHPLAGVVNISLWTLPLEVAAYGLLVALVATTMKAGRRWPVAVTAAALTIITFTASIGSPLVLMTSLFFVGATYSLYGYPRHPLIAVGAAAVLVASLGRPAAIVGMAAVSYLVLYMGTAYHPALRAVSKWGDPSYGMYIYGMPIGQTLVFVGISAVPLLFAASLIAAVIAGYASWHFVEQPALRWVRRADIAASPAPPPPDYGLTASKTRSPVGLSPG